MNTDGAATGAADLGRCVHFGGGTTKGRVGGSFSSSVRSIICGGGGVLAGGGGGVLVDELDASGACGEGLGRLRGGPSGVSSGGALRVGGNAGER